MKHLTSLGMYLNNFSSQGRILSELTRLRDVPDSVTLSGVMIK
jgi:hypothetical protein